MSARKKTKLCWHCHGTIPADVTHCAYCGERCELSKPEASPYFPPYPGDHSDTDRPSDASQPELGIAAERAPESNSGLAGYLDLRGFFQRCWHQIEFPNLMPALLLCWGAFFGILALFLCFFSEGPLLQVQLRADRWWGYLLFASALIWTGYLRLTKGTGQEHS